MQDPLDITHEISHAINLNKPVVALESSVIAQGLPKDVNVKTALELEEIVRETGAQPATIGVIEGKLRVGLTREEIEKLGQGECAKLAVRDLPYAVLKKLDGGTTVSATARIAAAVGITIMATGGIGGVHCGYTQTCDVSADMWELVRTPIMVVCSGAKAVLDIPATMEWLETHSVPVYGLGTDELPAFYSRTSGIKVPKMDDVEDVVELIKLCRGPLGIGSAIILGVPIPDTDEIDITADIAKAAEEAKKKELSGKEVTPFLLNKVAELTKGKSVEANIALLKNNARVAAEIACAVFKEERRRMGFV